ASGRTAPGTAVAHRQLRGSRAAAVPGAVLPEARSAGYGAGHWPVLAPPVRAATRRPAPLAHDDPPARPAGVERPVRPRRAVPGARLPILDGLRHDRGDVPRGRWQRPKRSRYRAIGSGLLRRDRCVHGSGTCTVSPRRRRPRELAPRRSLLLRLERSCDVDRQRHAVWAVLRARAAPGLGARARRAGSGRGGGGTLALGVSGWLPRLRRFRDLRPAGI